MVIKLWERMAEDIVECEVYDLSRKCDIKITNGVVINILSPLIISHSSAIEVTFSSF